MDSRYSNINPDDTKAVANAIRDTALGSCTRYDDLREGLIKKLGYDEYTLVQRVASLMMLAGNTHEQAVCLIYDEDIKNGVVKDIPLGRVRVLRKGKPVEGDGRERMTALRALSGEYTLEYDGGAGPRIPINIDQVRQEDLQHLAKKGKDIVFDSI